MSRQRYKASVTVEFVHDYFMDKQCRLILRPTPETNKLLMKRGMLLRKQNCAWILLMPENISDFTGENSILEFDIICPDNLFYYYTVPGNKVNNGINWHVEYIGLNGIFSKLKLMLDDNFTSNMIYQIPVCFESQQKYWEFILIPKFTDFSSKIKLTEDKSNMQFSSPEVINFPDKQKAFRIVTSDTIKLKEKYEYKIRLWEIMNNGERILNNSIQYPRPQSISNFSSKDTITSYTYY